MIDGSAIEIGERTEEYYRFQFGDPARFDEVVDAPDWAEETAETISDGATVRMGRLPDSEALEVESVAVPRKPNLGREEARTVAEKIVEEIHT